MSPDRNKNEILFTDQTRRTGESPHRHGMVVPDVTSHDETYLPGADYHEYEEIAAKGILICPSFIGK